MDNMFRNIPFSPPDMSEAEINEVADALRSGWITTGPRTKEFERQIAAYIGTNKAVCLNSATAAMEIWLRLIGVGPDDEVIIPAYTYTATASVIQHVGCRVVMVDSQKDNVEMDYDQLAEAITEKTKVICPVDLGGIVCDYDKIFAIVDAKRHLFRPANAFQKKIGRVIVAADDAHAYGSRWHGKMAGGIADFSAFSFHAVKNLTTAEGGALTWRLPFGGLSVERSELSDYMPAVPFIEGETWDELLYRVSQLHSLHGQNRDALAKTKLGAWEYDVIGPWYKCNMTDIMASIGMAQQRRYQGLLERRRHIIGVYDAALKDLPVAVLNHYDEDHQGNGHLYITRLLGFTDEQRREVIVKMAERGIACNVHYKPLPMMTAYKALGFDIKDYPNAYHLYENEITLPLHTRLSDEDVEYVISNYVDIIKQYIQKTERERIHLCMTHMSEEGLEQKYIQEAFDTNWVVPLGPNVNAFEKDLEEFVSSAKRVVALANGTAAVHLALIGCGVKPGDEVIVQSFTFCASSHPVTYLRAKPVFVDSEPDTWNMDPDLLEVAIKDRIAKTGKKPKAIVPVALYGMPYQVDRIMEIANRYEIPVIEDSAEGFGSRYNGQVLGTFGKYGVLSFSGNNMITTSGGGALITPDVESWKDIMMYATQYRESYPYYQHEKIGYNYRMSNVCAGIGRGQMTVANDHLAHHKKLKELYKELLQDVTGIEVHDNPDPKYDSNFWLITLTIDPAIKVKGQENAYRTATDNAHTDCEPNDNVEAMRMVLDAAGVESRPLCKPMHKQPVYAGAPAYVNGVSEAIFKVGLCVPSGPCVSEEDVKYIVETIKGAIV